MHHHKTVLNIRKQAKSTLYRSCSTHIICGRFSAMIVIWFDYIGHFKQVVSMVRCETLPVRYL